MNKHLFLTPWRLLSVASALRRHPWRRTVCAPDITWARPTAGGCKTQFSDGFVQKCVFRVRKCLRNSAESAENRIATLWSSALHLRSAGRAQMHVYLPLTTLMSVLRMRMDSGSAESAESCGIPRGIYGNHGINAKSWGSFVIAA